MKYRAEIDGLRAIAVTAVILFHAKFKIVSGGFLGVDIFFVISGYLITTILLDDIENHTFSFGKFYERRVRRIFPALFFVMFCCLPFGWLWMSPDQLKDFSHSIIAVSLFLSNIFFFIESGYFAPAAGEMPLLHTWSLAVEEQFYIFFPTLLLFAMRFKRRFAFLFIASLATASFLWSIWNGENNLTANFYLTHTRAWELFAGSLSSFIVRDFGIRKNSTLSFLGLLAILIPIFCYNQNTPSPGIYTLVPITGVVLVLLFADTNTFVSKLLSIRLFVGIGLISYSAYLWHQPLFAFARIKLLENPDKLQMISLCILSFVLATISWKFIEQPFRKKHAYGKNRALLFRCSITSILFFVVIGYIGFITDGFLYRFQTSIAGDISHQYFNEYLENHFYDCEPKEIATQALKWKGFLRCKQTRPGKPNIILLGDSHAEHLFPGLAQALPHQNVAFYIKGASPFITDQHFTTIFEELTHNGLNQTIIITMHYGLKSSSIVKDLSPTITKLQKAGKKIVLVGDVPQFSISASDCLYKTDKAIKDLCTISREVEQHQIDFYQTPLMQLSETFDIPYFNISNPICDENGCNMIQNNTILYRDQHHLNISGSLKVGKYLADLLQKQDILHGTDLTN
jgi:peptidoglycan/LPS O-acetylase OafA/YrhL